MSNNRPQSSIDTALSVIELLRDRPSVGTSEVSSTLQIAPSTAHRVLNILVRRGYARKTPDRRYVSGALIAYGDPGWNGDDDLVLKARPIMRNVVDEIHESVNLVVLEGLDVAYLEGIEARRTLRISAPNRLRLPAISSAAGKALLSHMTEGTIQRLFREYFPARASRSINSLQTLLSELERCRAMKYGTAREEFENGVSGIGVAVLGGDGRPVAGLAAAIPTYRFSEVNHHRIATKLRFGACQLTRKLSEKSE